MSRVLQVFLCLALAAAAGGCAETPRGVLVARTGRPAYRENLRRP